jgi:hypothetical protein
MTVLQQIRCYEIRNVSEANITGPLIQNDTWIEVFWENNVEKKLDSFYSIFNCYLNLSCPEVRRNIASALNVPWINNDVITARTKQKDLYDLHMQSKIQEHR